MVLGFKLLVSSGLCHWYFQKKLLFNRFKLQTGTFCMKTHLLQSYVVLIAEQFTIFLLTWEKLWQLKFRRAYFQRWNLNPGSHSAWSQSLFSTQITSDVIDFWAGHLSHFSWPTDCRCLGMFQPIVMTASSNPSSSFSPNIFFFFW